MFHVLSRKNPIFRRRTVPKKPKYSGKSVGGASFGKEREGQGDQGPDFKIFRIVR